MSISALHPFVDFLFCPKCGSKAFYENDFKSKRCDACGFVYYFNPSAAAVAVILDEQGRLLVCRRATQPAKGTLDLPGGFSDCFESAEESVAREVFEETGLQVSSTQFLFSLPNQYPYSGFVVHTLDSFFLCRVDDVSKMAAYDDAEEVMWIPLSEVNPEEFGLDSIRAGVCRVLAMRDELLQVK